MATTFYNKATLTYNGVTATSNTVTGELVEIVSATRTVLTDGYTRGTEKTFVISLVNTGSAPVTGLTVSDDLGEYTEGTLTLTPLTYVGGSAKIFAGGVEQTGVTVNAGPPLTFTGVGIPAGGSTDIVYKATANEFAPLGTGAEITAAATVTGAALAAPVEAAVTVSAEEGPILSIVKSVNPAVVAAAEYGVDVAAAAARENVMGCQFHPEKSGGVGLKILRAFCEMEGKA